MRDIQLFFSLEHLKAIVGLLICLISVLLCLQRTEGSEERNGGHSVGKNVGNTQHLSIKFMSYMSMVCGALKQSQ